MFWPWQICSFRSVQRMVDLFFAILEYSATTQPIWKRVFQPEILQKRVYSLIQKAEKDWLVRKLKMWYEN